MNPLVSIIIPVYNMEAYLAETLDSVLQTTYSPIEVIVVDDGSKDGSAAIAENYAAKDERVCFFKQENAGVCRTRNHAVEEAKGKYILPVDSDDVLMPDFVTWAVGQLEGDDDIKVAVPGGEFFGNRQGRWRLKPFSLRALAHDNMIPCTSLYRKSDWERIGGYCETIIAREDWEFWINMLKDGGKVVQQDAVGLRYRIREGSKRITDRKYKHHVIDVLNKRHAEFFKRELNGPLRYQRSWSRFINFFANLF